MSLRSKAGAAVGWFINGYRKVPSEAIQEQIRNAPTLKALNDATDGMLAQTYHDNSAVTRVREVVTLAAILTTLSLVAGGAIGGVRVELGKAASHDAEIVSGLVLALVLLGVMKYFNSRDVNRRLVVNLYIAIEELEKDPTRWERPRDRAHACGHIESAARALEAMPKAARVQNDPIAGGNLARAAARKAAALRWIKVWILRPQELTYTDTLAALAHTLRLVIDDQWYDLPEAEPVAATALGRWQRRGLMAIGALLLAGIGILVVFSAHLGSAGPVITWVAGILVVGVLAKLGISPSGLGQAAEIAANLGGK